MATFLFVVLALALVLAALIADDFYNGGPPTAHL